MSSQKPQPAQNDQGAPVEEQIEVLFRKAKPTNESPTRYPGFKPSTTILLTGSVHGEGALPLPCDLLFERDVVVPLRDGTILYVDIFRPVNTTNVPTIIAWSPYGKEGDTTFPTGDVPQSALSNLQKGEAPDPAYWCNHGYAVVNPDARGAFLSQGNIRFWGTQEGRDGADLIEWVSARDWSNGKVGLSGNSWLAIAQWFIAAERPPHLAAIAPWEGFTDIYRDAVARGGIPDIAFNEAVIGSLCGNNHVEDLPAMIQKYPLMNTYWQDKVAKLEQVDIPAYIVASYTNKLHTHGTFDGFCGIASKNKWLRVHNTHEWSDFYRNQDDLRRFFDHYLKGSDNGWETTPRVRLSVLDPGGTDVVSRPENEFPLARTQYQSLHLDAHTGTLSPDPRTQEAMVRYAADDGQGQAVFTMPFDQDTEVIGYMKLRLWVEANGANDMDLFVFVQKLDQQGNVLAPIVRGAPYSGLNGAPFDGANGRLRVSHRQLDPARSTPWEPYLTHIVEEPLSPGQIVPVDIAIWPLGMLWHVGQRMRVIVTGYNLQPPEFPGLSPIMTRNKGEHIIHTGGRYDSQLLVPMIPRWEDSGEAIEDMVTRPHRVAVNESLVMPTEEG